MSEAGELRSHRHRDDIAGDAAGRGRNVRRARREGTDETSAADGRGGGVARQPSCNVRYILRTITRGRHGAELYCAATDN